MLIWRTSGHRAARTLTLFTKSAETDYWRTPDGQLEVCTFAHGTPEGSTLYGWDIWRMKPSLHQEGRSRIQRDVVLCGRG